MPLKLLSSGGGSVLLTANTTASDFTVNVPAVNGNMVTTADTGSITQSMLGAGVYAAYGPCFRAYKSGSNQSLTSGSFTKITMTSTDYNIGSFYDTTNSRFLPTIAGYYNLTAAIGTEGSTSIGRMLLAFYKNGANMGNYLQDIQFGSTVAGQGFVITGTDLIYMNGSSDYIEVYAYLGGTGLIAGTSHTRFSGFLARAA